MAKRKNKKEIEKEIEKKIEKKVTNYFSDKNISEKLEKSSTLKIFGELIGYAIFLVVLFIIFPRLTFITDSFELWKPIAFWTTTFGTLLKILRHQTSINALARLYEMGELGLSLYSTYMLIVIFPFDFAKIGYPQFNIYFRYLMYLVIFALLIALLVNFIRIFFPEKKEAK